VGREKGGKTKDYGRGGGLWYTKSPLLNYHLQHSGSVCYLWALLYLSRTCLWLPLSSSRLKNSISAYHTP